jgi:DNA invertase Pin-like site-specific DNA recombinase
MEEGTYGLGHGYDIREVEGHGCLGTFREESSASFLTLRLAAARRAGKRLGRPPGVRGRSKLDGKAGEIHTLLKLHVSKASIAKITGVDRSTLYHFMRSRGLMPK